MKQHQDQASADSEEADLDTGTIVAAISDLLYQPSSSEEEELEYESYELPKAKNDIQIHEVTLSHHHLGDCKDLEAGTLICNGETMELYDGSFLMITEPRKSKNGHPVTLDGYLFRSVEDLEQYLPATFGGTEVLWLCEAEEHDPKPEGYLRSASSKDVLRIRHLVVTKSDYVPECPLQSEAIGMFTDTRPLICQWILVAEISKSRCATNSRNCQSIEKNKGTQGLPKAFIALSSEASIAGGIGAADISYFQNHLGQLEATSHIGSCQSSKHKHPRGRNLGKGKDRSGDVLAPETSGNRIAKATCKSARRKSSYHIQHLMLGTSSAQPKVLEHDSEPSHYTFADAFCGAGGRSVGARDAGLHAKWAFDHGGDAIDTYALNHGRDTCLQISAERFLEGAGVAYGKLYVDVLHLSPPCQGFALACRGSPQSGEINNKCMTYVDAILEKVKPRIVTFEEVLQVLFTHREYFTTMVRNLTSIGYNIRWKTFECVDFGVPQKRKRLFVIASCRGEPLPHFPKPTHAHPAHCEHLRLQSWNNFGAAIDNLEDGAPNHLQAHRRKERNIETWARPHPADWPCRGIVTTGENWPDHYNGKYMCTVREVACLQGFPTDYAFSGSLLHTKKQVVNAVPSPVAKAILEKVKRSMRRRDAARGS